MIGFIRKLFTPKPKCLHLRVRESMACDAWCRDCGGNLGFIQNWRDANRGNPLASERSNDPSDPLSWRPPSIITTKEPK